MIQSGSSSIADVKFGSQQIAKVCYGSDLVWEKDVWEEHTFPNSSEYFTSSDLLGFELQANPKSTTSYLYQIMDSNVSQNQTQLATLDTASDANNGRMGWLGIRFPTEWGTVKIKNFNINQWGNIYRYKIFSSTDRNLELSTSYNPLDGEVKIFEKASSNMSSSTYYRPTVNGTEQDVAARMLRLAGDQRSTSYNLIYLGNFTLTFLIKKSCYNAWKARYFS